MIGWRLPRVLSALCVSGLICLFSACQQPKMEKPEFGNLTVTGKVTYRGEPVGFGMVVLYVFGKNTDIQTGEQVPAAIAPIAADGSYRIVRAPSGAVQFCIVTDPDVSLLSLSRPAKLGDVVGTEPPSKEPPRPGEIMPPLPNPGAEKLTEEQKKLLKEIHAKYGVLGVPSLHYVLPPNTTELTHNFDLN